MLIRTIGGCLPVALLLTTGLARAEGWSVRDEVDPQRISLEVATLTSNGETFRGASVSTSAHIYYPDLGIPSAISVGAQLTMLGKQGELAHRSRWLFALPFTAGFSWHAYATPGTLLGIHLCAGTIYAFDTTGREAEHWLDVVGRVGADVTAFKLTIGADLYLMEGTPVVLRAGVAL